MSPDLTGILIDLSDFTLTRLLPLAAIILCFVLGWRWLRRDPRR
jgi:type II secretory pathway component PulF